MSWLRDSRWREHVVAAARCVEPARLTAFNAQLRQSIGKRRPALPAASISAATIAESAADLLPSTGLIASL